MSFKHADLDAGKQFELARVAYLAARDEISLLPVIPEVEEYCSEQERKAYEGLSPRSEAVQPDESSSPKSVPVGPAMFEDRFPVGQVSAETRPFSGALAACPEGSESDSESENEL